MHALLYVFRTENSEDKRWNDLQYFEDACMCPEDYPEVECIKPLYDWYDVGGRFSGSIPLKKEYLHLQEEYLVPGRRKTIVENGVDYAKYEWIDLDNWRSIPPFIIIDNELIHDYTHYKDYDEAEEKAKEIMEKLKEKGFYDVTAIDIHY